MARSIELKGVEAAGSARRVTSDRPARFCLGALLLLPGSLTMYLAVNSGGMFPVTTGAGSLIVIVAILIVLVALTVWGETMMAKPSVAIVIPFALLALLGLWTLASSRWSHAPERAQEAYGRVLLYLLTFTFFGLMPSSARRLGSISRGVLLAIVAVALLALSSRLVPSIVHTTPGLEDERLNYPITYWNTLGMLLGLGCILALHHTSEGANPRTLKLLAAMALPLLASALLLTFSRGAIGATTLGLLIYAAIARPRGLIGGCLATAPSVVIGLLLTAGAHAVQKGTPWTPAAIEEGHRLAMKLAICSVAAGVLRAALFRVDMRVARLRTPPWSSRQLRSVVLLGACGLLAIAVAGQLPARLRTQYEHFVEDRRPLASSSSERLFYVGNDGRLSLWRVAVSSFQEDPVRGTGAGTFRLQWERNQQSPHDRVYAYSLYAETLGELGLVGAALLGGCLLAVSIALVGRARRRPIYAAVLGAFVAWAAHAGVDLDWQTPAVTLPVMAMVGGALATDSSANRQAGDGVHRAVGRPLKRIASGRWARTLLPLLLVLLCAVMAVEPLDMVIAQSADHGAVRALGSGECVQASKRAHDALDVSGASPTPDLVLAVCAGRAGRYQRAVSLARSAVAKDPDNWQMHYVLALLLGLAGQDPRREARKALVAYPSGRLSRMAAAVFHGGGPPTWRREARMLPLVLESG